MCDTKEEGKRELQRTKAYIFRREPVLNPIGKSTNHLDSESCSSIIRKKMWTSRDEEEERHLLDTIEKFFNAPGLNSRPNSKRRAIEPVKEDESRSRSPAKRKREELKTSFLNRATHFRKMMENFRIVSENRFLFPLVDAPNTKSIATKLRRLKNPAIINEQHHCVVIWDIDDIAMLSKHMVLSIAKEFPDFDSDVVRLYELVERILITAGFEDPDDLLEADVINIEDIEKGATRMENIVSKYNALRKIYSEHREEVNPSDLLINMKLITNCGLRAQLVKILVSAERHQEIFRHRWKYVRQCLEYVNNESYEWNMFEQKKKYYANVVLCEEGVAHGAGQLLASWQSLEVPIENVYSTANRSKKSVVERIKQRFGEKCEYLVISSMPETISIAEKLDMHFRQINDYNCFERSSKNIYSFIEHHLRMNMRRS